MVTYGPWTQDPDYNRSHTIADAAARNIDRLENHSVVVLRRETPSGSWPNGIELAEEGILAAGWPYDDEWTGSSATIRARVDYGPTGDIFIDPWAAVATVDRAPGVVGVFGGHFYYPDLPAEAIGVEWENGAEDTFQPPSIVSRVLDAGTTLRQETACIGLGPEADIGFTTNFYVGAADTVTWQHDGADGWQVASFYSEGWPGETTALRHIASATTHSASAPGTRTLGKNVDLTPYLDRFGRCVLFPVTLNVDMRQVDHDPGTTNDILLEFGWRFQDLRLVTTYRPPVYRFIYDTPPVSPPRRIYPRDDGMTGGARRTWPPSKSQQWGNRVDGSGYV